MAINIPFTPTTIPTTNRLPPIPVTTQTGTTYTFGVGDAQGWVRFTNAGTVTITVPPSTFPVGTQIIGEAASTTSLVQFVAGAGVTLLPGSPMTALAPYSIVILFQVATDVWNVAGSVA